MLTAADMDIDTKKIGLKGSPTKVKRSFTPAQKKAGIILKEETASAAASKLITLLEQAAVL